VAKRKRGNTSWGKEGRQPEDEWSEGERDLRGRVADLFELPKDVVLDLPRLTMIGHLQITIENHRGVRDYEDGHIIIALQRGELRIGGRGLAIGTIYQEEILITGFIQSLEFIQPRGGGGNPDADSQEDDNEAWED